jgi:hypothetical protein
MRSFLIAVAVSLPMQFAQADTFISRSSGTMYDPFGLYGSGTGPYTLEVRSEFDPANMLDTNNPSVVFIRDVTFDLTVTHNNVSKTFTSPGSLQLRILDIANRRIFEQVMFYNYGQFDTAQIFSIDASVFPESRPLQPAAAESTKDTESIGSVRTARFLVYGNEVLGINGEAWSTSIDSYSFQMITSVPEPRSYAMLAAGIGLLGCVIRRRKCA